MKKENFLDWIMVKNPQYEWEEEEGIVTILVEHKKIFDRFAQKFFHKPRISKVRLDEYGSFVWKKIDGKNTVGDLALFLKEQYSEGVEPLYPRLTQYIKILMNNKFVKRKTGR